MTIDLQREIDKIPDISSRKYWFVRSYHGNLYKNFIEHGYIGMGLNQVPMSLIGSAQRKDLSNYILKNTKFQRKQSATLWANQLILFVEHMREGDLVITPSEDSNDWQIGKIVSGVYLVKQPGTFNHQGNVEEYPEKRRMVEWIRELTTEEMKSDLRGVVTRLAITNLTPYGHIVEGFVSSVFKKGNEAYLVVKVDQDDNINAFVLSRFLNELTYFYQFFCKESGIQENEELYIKIKLQSKGKMWLIGTAIVGMAGLGFVIFSDGINIHVKLPNGVDIEIEGAGIPKSITNYKDAEQNREQKKLDSELERFMKYEEFKDSMQQLQIERKMKTLDSELKRNHERKSESEE